MITRRELLRLGIPGACGLGGCVPPTLQMTRNSIRATHSAAPANAYGVDPEFLEQLPYAVLGVQVNREAGFIAVLATVDNGRYTWASADSRILVTQAGFLVGTQGFDRDLTALRWHDAPPLPNLDQLDPSRRVYRDVDLSAGRHHETGLPIESRFVLRGSETIKVLGTARSTVKVQETANVRKWRWQADNSYWIDPDQQTVWRSTQSYCPEVGMIELELLKKPSV